MRTASCDSDGLIGRLELSELTIVNDATAASKTDRQVLSLFQLTQSQWSFTSLRLSHKEQSG